MRKLLSYRFSFIVALLVSLAAMTSCSETEDTFEEFPEWQKTNEAYFDNLYKQALEAIASGDNSWAVIRNWSFPKDGDGVYVAKPCDHIVVKKLENGTGTECPLFTDYCSVHYRGWLLPSVTYTEGLQFDSSYQGDFNPDVAVPVTFQATSGISGGVVDGFSTALQNMHVGDHWMVYIPYQLGYGTTDSNSIPAYSTLKFELRLESFKHNK